MTVEPSDRQHGAELNDDFKGASGYVLEAQQVGRNNQVPCGRDRQELSNALNEAEKESLQQVGYHRELQFQADWGDSRKRTPKALLSGAAR
jgi:hypothetical protein